LFFLNPNNKIFILFFFVYLGCLFLFTRDFKKSLLLAYLASWPFHIGKTYEIELVPAWQLNLPFRPYGITDNFVISIQEIFIVLMLLVIIREIFIKGRQIFRFDFLSWLLLFYFFSLIIASFFGSIRPEISLVYALYSIEPLILYLYVRVLIKNIKNIASFSLAVLAAIGFLEFLLAGIQFLTHQPLGLSIEESIDFLPIDTSLESDVLDFRPVGTFSHANWLANFLLPLLFIFLPSVFVRFKGNTDKIFISSFFFIFLTFLLTLSRSAWISFFFSFLLFLLIVEKKWRLRLTFKPNITKAFYFSLPLLLLLVVFFVMPRLLNTFYAFEIYGAGYTRFQLLKESIQVIGQNFLFGVGLGMDILYNFQQSVVKSGSIFSYFPESVHNGYLHLLLQAGIFPFLIFSMISVIILKKLIKVIEIKGKNFSKEMFAKKILILSLLTGFLSLYLNAFFQPFLPDLKFLIFLGFIYSNKIDLGVKIENT